MDKLDEQINNVYKDIISLKTKLYEKEEKYKKLKYEKYDSCKHVLIISDIDRDEYEGRSYNYYGCIKCGLNTQIKKFYSGLTTKEKNMYLYLRDKKFKIPGKYIEMDYNFTKARKIWLQIKENNPNVKEDILLKVFIEEIYKEKNDTTDIDKIKIKDKDEFGPRNIWDYP